MWAEMFGYFWREWGKDLAWFDRQTFGQLCAYQRAALGDKADECADMAEAVKRAKEMAESYDG